MCNKPNIETIHLLSVSIGHTIIINVDKQEIIPEIQEKVHYTFNNENYTNASKCFSAETKPTHNMGLNYKIYNFHGLG